MLDNNINNMYNVNIQDNVEKDDNLNKSCDNDKRKEKKRCYQDSGEL